VEKNKSLNGDSYRVADAGVEAALTVAEKVSHAHVHRNRNAAAADTLHGPRTDKHTYRDSGASQKTSGF
jgi:hypothetical protein